MPKNPTSLQAETSRKNGQKSRGGKSDESPQRPARNVDTSGLRSETVALMHESVECSERCARWFAYYQPQSPATIHLTNELARATLLADRAENSRQAELEQQGAAEERAWNRKQRRRLRYLEAKLNRCPHEARQQLEGFQYGLEFLKNCLGDAIQEIQDRGYLPPDVFDCIVQVCGALPDRESIRANPMTYLIQLYNLGATPGAPAEEIAYWLEPAHRPEDFRDEPRDALFSSDADVCRGRLVGLLHDDLDRVRGLVGRVRREVDMPSLKAALDRASILNDAAARRVGRSRAEARTTFHRALHDLIKMLKRDAEEGPYDPERNDQAEPEKESANSTPFADQPETYDSRSGSMAGGAKPAQSGEQTPSDAAQAGADMAREGEGAPGPLSVEPSILTSAVLDGAGEPTAAVVRPESATEAVEPAAPGAMGTTSAAGSAGESGAASVDQTERRWSELIPLSACRREGSLLHAEPEKDDADLTQRVDEEVAYPSPSGSNTGGAKAAQTGEQTRPSGEARNPKSEIRNEFPDSTHGTPRSTPRDPLRAVIEKYQRKFDEQLRPYDHLE